MTLSLPFFLFARPGDFQNTDPQQETLQKEGQLLSMKLVLGEPLRLYVAGKEHGKIDLSKLKLKIRRIPSRAGSSELMYSRLENHIEIPATLDSEKATNIEVTAELEEKKEKVTFTIDPKTSRYLQTKEMMNSFLTEFTALKKFFVSETAFNDPKNSEEIGRRLKKFAQLAKETRHDPMLRQVNFKFSRDVLEKHLAETERVYRLGNKSYARWQLASTASVCMGCHTQMPSESRHIQDFKKFDSMASSFDQAEFLFTTHAFDRAMELYDQVIDGYPKNKSSLDDLETSLERQIAYFSRVLRDPVKALEKMQIHAKNSGLPENVKVKIGAWIKQFQNWEKQANLDPKTATAEQVIKFARKNIQNQWTTQMMAPGNPSLVTYLRVSGILYEFLKNNPSSKETPEILYWLSICDRSLSNTFFYSLADLYLRECMIQYPSSSIAKKCYSEYEAEMVLGYTGSSGTHLPEEVKAELQNLKKHVDSGGKVELRGF